MIKKLTVVFFTCLLMLVCGATQVFAQSMSARFIPDENNQFFRNEIVQFIRACALHDVKVEALSSQFKALDAKWDNAYQKSNWMVKVTPFYLGKAVGLGEATSAYLAVALKAAIDASIKTLLEGKQNLENVNRYRFKVAFNYYPSGTYSFIDYKNTGYELVGNRVAIRKMSTEDVVHQVESSEGYLLRNMHPIHSGFFKFYDATLDKAQDELRTIYSASSLLTLLKANAWQSRDTLRQHFKPIAKFILANQAIDGPAKGAFAYSYNPKTNKRKHRYVVGTTSKTIFTLLALHDFYKGDSMYIDAAKNAGDWLLTMVRPDGSIISTLNCDAGICKSYAKQSLLYAGQVLSALSRLYIQTHDKRYYDGALKIANQFVRRIKQEGVILGDDYRPANSISSSWVMMSLLDFSKIDNQPSFFSKRVVQIAKALLMRQIKNENDVFNNGRYLDAMTASGNGWLNEVFGEFYFFCKAHNLDECSKYRTAIIRTSRWLLQNAYTNINTYNVKNPQRAIGGFITNFNTQSVRTDAVCHGVNGLLALLEIIGSKHQLLIQLPERPLAEILPLMRAGDRQQNA